MTQKVNIMGADALKLNKHKRAQDNKKQTAMQIFKTKPTLT